MTAEREQPTPDESAGEDVQSPSVDASSTDRKDVVSRLVDRFGRASATFLILSIVITVLVTVTWVLAGPAEDVLPDVDASDPSALDLALRHRGLVRRTSRR